MGLENIINITNLVVVSYVSNVLINYVLVKKEYKLDISNKVELTPPKVNKYNDLNISKITLKYKKNVLNFIKVMIKNFNEKDLINFYNNINSLKIAENNLILRKNLKGVYHGEVNVIEITDKFEECIFHELFHMSSFCFVNNILFCGFSQYSVDDKIGLGINEGYTELLTRRYFEIKDKSSYYLEIEIAKKIEELIGKEKMQSLYLNSNLYGLIEELEKYNTEENIIEFIRNVDFICKYKDNINNKITFTYREFIIKCFKNIYKFLVESYTKKLLLESNLSNKEIIDKISYYVNKLIHGVMFGEGKYKDSYQFINNRDKDYFIRKIKKIIYQYNKSR